MTEHSLNAKKYLAVFGALMVLTLLTVGVAQFHFGIILAVSIALLIATLKGGLVASFFMHLIGENKWIYLVLAFTIFFFLFLLLVPSIVTMSDYNVK
ncbi:MAG: cytochrome C oxidase subunit IV family protein [Bdellovibrionales bacterium]|nr:cytochrome C oxidase subunit IV family protein [Bdellovibrionales bacterium]